MRFMLCLKRVKYDRMGRLGEKVAALKHFVGRENVRLAKVEKHSKVTLWVVGIFGAIFISAIIGACTQLLALNGRISKMEANASAAVEGMEELRLSNASQTPAAPESIQEVQQVLASARTKQVKLDADSIARAGSRFVDASTSNREAWSVVLQFADYRSSQINPGLVPSLRSLRQSSLVSDAVFPNGFTVKAFGYATSETSALIGLLDQAPIATRVQWIVADPRGTQGQGQGYVLDGKHMRNTVIVNSNVGYDGGPTDLENIYFINCKFSLSDRNQAVRSFANAVIAGTPVTFQQP